MVNLIRAGEGWIDRIIAETYPHWNEGLNLDGYRRWNALQMRTEWGAKHLWRVALIDGDALLASAKWYDLHCEFNGSPLRVLGIGAVFTPERERGRGRARELMTRMMDAAEAEGYGAALLFSEIGAPFYERAGFTVIPRDTLTLDIRFPRPGAPATLIRVGEDRDLPYLSELHSPATFFLPRPAELIKHNVVKRRVQAASAPAGVRTVEFFVSEEGHRPVAYVLLTRTPSGNLGDGPETMWLEACGDRDPSGARVGAMLQALSARTPAESWPPLHAWLPDGWLPPQLAIVERAPAADIMMIRPLGKTFLPPLTSKDVVWWHADYF